MPTANPAGFAAYNFSTDQSSLKSDGGFRPFLTVNSHVKLALTAIHYTKHHHEKIVGR
jgi:hypothetical protein